MTKIHANPQRLATGLAAVALVGAISGQLAGCSQPDAAAPVLPAVYVTVAQNDNSSSLRTLSANLRPRIESELSFRVGGRVTARMVEVGQVVRSGQVMAKLDATDYQLGAAAAGEQLKMAQVDAEQAASDAARFKRLSADGSVGSADLERQQARADAAAARVQQAQHQLELARNRAGYALLTAPFDGVVTALRMELGQTVAEGQMVVTVAQPGQLELVADVPEMLAPQLSRLVATGLIEGGLSGQSAAAQQTVALKLRELSPSAAPVTRTFRARYTLLTAKGQTGSDALRMGMTAQLQLGSQTASPTAELPLAAILTTDKQAAVWLVNPSTGELKNAPVQILAQTASTVRVTGLADGALVVSAGAQKLDASIKVRPVARPLATLVSQR